MTLALALSAGGKDDRAIQMARSGLPMGPDDPYPHEVLGQCLEVAGHQDEAMAEYHRALCLAPNLMTTIPAYKSRPNLLYDGPVEQRFAYWKLILAMAEYRSGNANKARVTLDSALKMYDWNQEDRSDPDGWMFRVLRREAEAMIPPAATQPAN